MSLRGSSVRQVLWDSHRLEGAVLTNCRLAMTASVVLVGVWVGSAQQSVLLELFG